MDKDKGSTLIKLIDYLLFYVPLIIRIFHLYDDVIIAGEGLQNLYSPMLGA
jgi:hypothetical protein